MSADLMARLTAALDAEEALARSMPPFPWRLNDEGDEVVAADGEIVCEPFALSNQQVRNMARYFVAHDPQATSDQVAAAREILTAWETSERRLKEHTEKALALFSKPARTEQERLDRHLHTQHTARLGGICDALKVAAEAIAKGYRIEVES